MSPADRGGSSTSPNALSKRERLPSVPGALPQSSGPVGKNERLTVWPRGSGPSPAHGLRGRGEEPHEPEDVVPVNEPHQQWDALRAVKRHAGVLQRHEFAALRQHGTVRHVPSGTVVASAGTRISHVQVVAAGELQLCARVDGRRVAALIVRPGGVICDIPLLLNAPMPYDAVATQQSELIELTCERWMSMLASNPGMCFRWMQSMASRLDDDRRRLLVTTSRPLAAQVAYLLLELAEPGVDGALEVHLSQATLAQLLGARRQSVSRVLCELRDKGCILSRYGVTVLVDVEGLRSVSGSEPLPIATST